MNCLMTHLCITSDSISTRTDLSSGGALSAGQHHRADGGDVEKTANHVSISTTSSSSSSTIVFNADQVTCLCQALQQAGDIDHLASFIGSLAPEEMVAGGESVLRARVAVAFHQGRYGDLFALLEGHQFDPSGHPWLQQLWYRAHYAEAEKARGRPLG